MPCPIQDVYCQFAWFELVWLILVLQFAATVAGEGTVQASASSHTGQIARHTFCTILWPCAGGLLQQQTFGMSSRCVATTARVRAACTQQSTEKFERCCCQPATTLGKGGETVQIKTFKLMTTKLNSMTANKWV